MAHRKTGSKLAASEGGFYLKGKWGASSKKKETKGEFGIAKNRRTYHETGLEKSKLDRTTRIVESGGKRRRRKKGQMGNAI